MDERAAQIRKHIEVLAEFEQKYGEYFVARHNRGVEEHYSDWSSREWAERERELRTLAPRADAAMVASGLDPWADLPGMILNFDGWTGFSSFATEDNLQREILAQIPSQIEGLRMRLEEVEAESRRLKLPKLQRSDWGWVNHPWTITIVGTVIAGIILALILGGN
jgi:hypothetical protein